MITELKPIYSEYVPERRLMKEGELYISKEYHTASHLCICGCGNLVVTPLKIGDWSATTNGNGEVSLTPSIGNWNYPCQSHYLITNNKIVII